MENAFENCICVRDFEKLAAKRLSKDACTFFNSGSTDEQTLEENCTAFKKWRFQPRVLRDVSKVDTTTTVLEDKIPFPICVAPTAMNKMASTGGELDSAKAAARLKTVFTLSSWATTSMEEIGTFVPSVLRWFQLFMFKDREVTESLVRSAERHGFRAIVVKGIFTSEMALEAVICGVAGILVSNHGARQLDGVLPTIYALPQVIQAVQGRCEVYLDGGIRNGGDVAKAIALGARAVFVGRPMLLGLACGGEEGARKVLEILRGEFELTMKLLGARSIAELQMLPNLVVHESAILAKL